MVDAVRAAAKANAAAKIRSIKIKTTARREDDGEDDAEPAPTKRCDLCQTYQLEEAVENVTRDHAGNKINAVGCKDRDACRERCRASNGSRGKRPRTDFAALAGKRASGR